MSPLRLFAPLAAVALLAGPVRSDTPSAREYPFPVAPLDLYERFVRLNVGKPEPLPPADAKRLAAFWAARSAKPPKPVPPADDAAVTLHLIACGVPEKQRAGYLQKFNALVSNARKAVAGAASDRAKADALLRFLHQGALAKGYAERQTTISDVFDTGKYNCVSSSALYFLVGTRLGLKLQPVLIPGEPNQVGHAAVDLFQGKARVEVEPTNPEGFDWPEKIKRPGVKVVGLVPDRKKAYDADGFGLAGAAASNRGNESDDADAPRPADAVRFHAVALTLDPRDPTAANNMAATVSNWGLTEEKAGRFEESVKLFAFAREAFGDREKVEHNYRVVWERYLDRRFGEGKVEEGVRLVRRAAEAFPDEKRFADPAEWATRAARAKAEKDGWGAGLVFADDALKALTGDEAKRVRGWKTSARRQWSQKLLADGDADGSLRVIADGLKESPGDKNLMDGLGYHTQEALAALAKKGGAAAAAHFKQLVEAFPENKELRDAGYRHAARAVRELSDAKKYAEAADGAARLAPLAGERAGELRAQAVDSWGRALAAEGKWEESLKRYAEGLKALPNDSRLTNNAVATADEWAKSAMDKGDWAGAVRVYDAALQLFPENAHLKNNREYSRQKAK